MNEAWQGGRKVGTSTVRPMVSIVMPSLNVGRYVEQCLSSVVAQTLRDIEILCVDAGSTDGTLETIEAFAERDARIKVIHSPVKSYGAQINQGLDAATGKYIGIVETDDWVEPEMFATLVDVAERHGCEVVKSDHIREYGTHSEYSCLVPFAENLYGRVLSPAEDWRVFRFQMMNWTGIFRRDCLMRHGVRCNETPGAAYQDNGFWFSSLAVTERFVAVPKAFYHYRLNNANQSVASVSKSHCVRDEFAFIRAFLERNRRFAKFKDVYHVTLLASALWLLNKIIPEKRPEVAEWIRRVCSEDLGLPHGIPDGHFLLRQLFDWELRDLCPLLEAKGAGAFLRAKFGYDWESYGTEGREAFVSRFIAGLTNAREGRLAPLFEAMDHVDFAHERRALDFFRRIAPSLPKRTGGVRRMGLYYHRLYDGGTERVLTLVADLLHKHDYEIVLITDEPPNPDDYPTQATFRRAVFPAEARLFRNPVNLGARARFWEETVLRERLDAVCHLGRWASTRAFDLLTLRCVGVTALMYDHNASYAALSYGDVPMFLDDTAVFALADAVICLSRGEAAYWTACGLHAAYVPNPPVFPLEPLPPTASKTVLWLGRLARSQKRPLDALKAIDIVRRRVPNVVLTILGDGAEMEALRRFCQARDLDKHVRFEGFHEHVAPFFDDVRVHLLTSSYESWSLVWAEAKSKGIPTVMYDLPGLELARRSEGFLGVPMGDCQALADALVAVLNDDEAYARLRTACIRTADTIDEEEVVQAWEALFLKLGRQTWPTSTAIPDSDVRAMTAMLRLGIWGLAANRVQPDSNALDVSAELSAVRELMQHRIVRAVIDMDAWTRRVFPPGNTMPRRIAKRAWSFAIRTRKGIGGVVKQFVPYGIMRVWLKVRYDKVIDEPLLAYPGAFKRAKRLVKFSLPYGLVEAWKHADVATQVNGGSGIVSVFRRILRPRGK